MHQNFRVRCRGVILHEGKVLLTRHMRSTGIPADFLSLPGGHLELGESPEECMARELHEELGVRGEVGRLMYVHMFGESVEFFFEITNGADFINHADLEKTHAYEIAEVEWVSPEEDVRILPESFAKIFKEGEGVSDTVQFLS